LRPGRLGVCAAQVSPPEGPIVDALVHGVRRAAADVRPIDVLAVDSHADRCAGVGDEVLIDAGAIQVGAADRPGA